MNTIRFILQTQKFKSIMGVLITLSVIHFIENPLVILMALLPLWYFFFRPWNRENCIIFIVALLFFLGQNYAVLKTGGFSFKHKDILLMPYYEPFMWGFYYLTIKRFVGEPPRVHKLEGKAFFGLLLTSASFSLFPGYSQMLLLSSLISTSVLFLMFHEKHDLLYALFALVLGFVVEIFGVSTGLWSYPAPDFMGIPYWFATMWVSAGLLGRRFLIPLAEWLSNKFN